MAQKTPQQQLDEGVAKKKPQVEAAQPKHVSPGAVQRAIESPGPDTLTADVVNQLQSSHGNQFVSQLVRQSGAAGGSVQREEGATAMAKLDSSIQREEGATAMAKLDSSIQREEGATAMAKLDDGVQRQEGASESPG